jgi:hypothetical protein
MELSTMILLTVFSRLLAMCPGNVSKFLKLNLSFVFPYEFVESRKSRKTITLIKNSKWLNSKIERKIGSAGV